MATAHFDMAGKRRGWVIGLPDFDEFPPEAREALANSRYLGSVTAEEGLRIRRARGTVMAERIRQADKLFCVGNNLGHDPRVSKEHIIDILTGRRGLWT